MATKSFDTESVTKYVVKRSGVKVPRVDVDPDTIDSQLGVDDSVAETVIAISPPPGTTVPRGTKVDITLAPAWNLKPPILKVSHRDLQPQTFEMIYNTFLGNDDVKRIVSENKTAASIKPADKAVLSDALVRNNIKIGTEAGTTLDAALSTLRGALTFGARGR